MQGSRSSAGNRPRHRIERVEPAQLPALLEDILEIEALCFPRPWGPDEFRSDLTIDGAFLDVVLVGCRGGARVVAFCSCRRIYDELHVLQIATHPRHQRKGYGGELLVHAIRTARQRGCAALLLEVRPSNREAVALYEKQGFLHVGVRRRYYADNGEDALVMRCEVGA